MHLARGTSDFGARYFVTYIFRSEAMATPEQKRKIEKVMHEKKVGTLRSSSGKKVTSRKQAIAIAMSESGQSRKRKPIR